MSASLCNAGHEIVGAVCSRCYEDNVILIKDMAAELSVLRKSWGATDLLRMTTELTELRDKHVGLEAQSKRDRDAWCHDISEKVKALKDRDTQARLFAEAENRAWVLRGERDGALKRVESLEQEASSQRILELSLKTERDEARSQAMALKEEFSAAKSLVLGMTPSPMHVDAAVRELIDKRRHEFVEGLNIHAWRERALRKDGHTCECYAKDGYNGGPCTCGLREGA